MSVIERQLFRGVFPDEISTHILSFLPVKNLGDAEQVSKEWKELASQNFLWKGLFFRIYQQQIPEGMTGKGALSKWSKVEIVKESELPKLIISFLCKLKWDKKRQLECTFPNNKNNSSMLLEQSFGPNRGTKEGFKGPIDDKESYKCDLTREISLYYTEPVEKSIAPKNEKGGIPLCTSMRSPVSEFSKYEIVSIEVDVDVGYGNTLAIYSAINDWKEPFELYCLPKEEGSFRWCGYLPYGDFKFVKIDSQSNITWESRYTNRTLDFNLLNRSYGTLEAYFRANPITFPN